MNQQQIGSFLKELRKEKGLTQEQLAEQFGVAGRTVSRWETGSNMPDLSLLIELADFYQVGIREIFDGERNEKNMTSEKNTFLNENVAANEHIRTDENVGMDGNVAVANTKEFAFLKKIVEYTELEKELIIKKMYKNNLIALASLFALYAFSVSADAPNYYILLKVIAVLLALFAIIDSVLYATGKRKTLKNGGREKKSHFYWPIIVCAILAVLIVVVAVIGLQAAYPGEDVWMSLKRIFG